MKNFIFGVFVTTLIGGYLMHVSFRYHTFDICTALEHGLTEAVTESLIDDRLPQTAIDMVIRPVAEPLVNLRIRSYISDRSLFGCAGELIRLELDPDNRVAELRSFTLHF
ncbi:MAG: hypothetical protein WCF85_17170 [Rhodospirillaceae bacterium]